jgi:hypothetical protein
MTAKPRKTMIQDLKDRILTEMRLKDFDPENCPAAKLLTQLFGGTINATDLIQLAETCAFCLDIYLDRKARRRKSVLLKWFNGSLQIVGPFFGEHVVENKSQELLGSGGRATAGTAAAQEADCDAPGMKFVH